MGDFIVITYPLAFSYQSESASGTRAAWITHAPEGRSADCAIPPEFEGPGQGYSPEDFFGLALLNCFVATFKVIAEKSRVPFESLTVSGKLIVDRDEQGRPAMKSFALDARIVSGAGGDPARIRRVFDKTAESCIVANSVKTEVRFALEVG
jgi:organic hydroperoxide reductase OsmC/OhrA